MEKPKLPKLRVSKSGYKRHGAYLVEADLDQKERHSFTGESGEVFSLIIPRDENNNYKERLPDVVKVVDTYGDVDFPVGTELYIDFFILMNHDGDTNHIFVDESGKKYWKVDHEFVYAGIVDGEIIPNSDIVLCEYVEDKLYETTLHLAGSLSGDRQDVAKVVISNNPEYPVGCYILVEDYSLYEITFKGKKLCKVDVKMEDIIGIISDPSIRKTKVLNMNLANE